ncbi:MAG: hypothetical protein QM534_06385 [Sediminibacterium sp.]|nr:hypothetical protein [Sediminibacterium sp.]
MAHGITALILKGSFDVAKAEAFDLYGKPLGFDLTLFHIDHYYSACWQHLLNTSGKLDVVLTGSSIFPDEIVLAKIARSVSTEVMVAFAIIQTDYFGGIGSQYANVFIEEQNADHSIQTINQALEYLGVIAKTGMDAFDTVGLSGIRSQPGFLNKYVNMADDYGV